jgi:hypothetical protein
MGDCAGIWLHKVTVSVLDLPNVIIKPDLAMRNTTLKSGSAKVVWPLPPKVLPSNENKAVFWLMGKICPLQSAHPTGAKFPANILISASIGFIKTVFVLVV